MGFGGIEKTIQKRRRAGQPGPVGTIAEAAETLQDHRYGRTIDNQPFFRGRVVTADGEALVFASLEAVRILANAQVKTHWLMLSNLSMS